MAGAAGPWLVRSAALGALALTLWLAGPRAWHVLEARVSQHAAASGEPVRLDRARLLSRPPPWLRGPVLRAFLSDLEPRLRGEVGIMDEAGARAVVDRLRSSSWILSAAIERRFPDRFRVDLSVRRPILEVVADGRRLALVDAEGIALPAPDRSSGLPRAPLFHETWRVDAAAIELGRPFPDDRVLAAAAVAREWLEDVRPAVDAAPELREVDAQNLGWRYIADPESSQVLISLARQGGGTAVFDYGLAHSRGGPVAPAVKAEIMRRILSEFPGLHGVERGDLRRRNLWRHCLTLR